MIEQIEAEAIGDGVLMTVVDSFRASLNLSAGDAKALYEAITACLETGERQTVGEPSRVDVFREFDRYAMFLANGSARLTVRVSAEAMDRLRGDLAACLA